MFYATQMMKHRNIEIQPYSRCMVISLEPQGQEEMGVWAGTAGWKVEEVHVASQQTQRKPPLAEHWYPKRL